MRNSLIALLLFAPVAFAQVDRRSLKIKSAPPAFDLIKESDSLQVLKEESVQKDEKESRYSVGFNAGAMQANSLTLASNGQVVRYDLSQAKPVFNGAIGYYPARFGGYWGLLSSINYSYREQSNELAKSSLHLFGGDAVLSYRYEMTSTAWVKPYLGAGPGIIIAMQRGIDEYNTSEAHGLGVAAVGLGFNVKRLFGMNSPLDWEVQAQYKRWIEFQHSNTDYNGQLITLGLDMLL